MKHGFNYSAAMLQKLGELARGALHEQELNVREIQKQRGSCDVEAVEVTYQQRGPDYRIVRQRIDRQGEVETLAYQGPIKSDCRGDWKRKGGLLIGNTERVAA